MPVASRAAARRRAPTSAWARSQRHGQGRVRRAGSGFRPASSRLARGSVCPAAGRCSGHSPWAVRRVRRWWRIGTGAGLLGKVVVRGVASSVWPADADVVAAQGGSSAAFERLFRCVQPSLVRYLGVLVGQDAQDVASETWLQVARDLGSFRGGGSDFTGWVVTIGRHRALDHLRSARRRPSDPWAPDGLPARPAAEDTFEASEEAASTRRALSLIAQLPPDQAEAVLLRVVVGLDAPAAAKVLGKRAGAVRMATSRGLAGLREILDQAAGVTLSAAQTLERLR